MKKISPSGVVRGAVRASRGGRDGVKPLRRSAYAHMKHPADGVTTLCGETPLRLEPCPVCLAKYAYMRLIHVSSTKKPDMAFCGLPIPIRSGRGAGRLASRRADRPAASVAVTAHLTPFVISAQEATELMRRMPGLALHLCPGCATNLRRSVRMAPGLGQGEPAIGGVLGPGPGLGLGDVSMGAHEIDQDGE